MKPITEIDDPRLVKALAHPLRVRILRVLEKQTASPSDIATRIGAPLGNVSYHVRALERVGLIELDSTAPRRGALEHYYKAAGRIRVSNEAWREVPNIVKAKLVDSALGQIVDLAGNAAADGGFDREQSVLSRWSLHLDEQGYNAVADAAQEFIDRAREIERESVERRSAAGPHEGAVISSCLAVMLFEPSAADADGGEAAAETAGKSATH